MEKIGKYIHEYVLPEILEANKGLTKDEFGSILVGTGFSILCASGNTKEIKGCVSATNSLLKMFVEENE